MKYPRMYRFAWVLLAAILNIALAYAFGNDGFEVFITTGVALALLFTWQSAHLSQTIWKSETWLLLRLAGSLMIWFCWFVVIIASLLSTIYPTINPRVTVPLINWVIVLIGIIPYLLVRLIFSKEKVTVTNQVTGALATAFSIMTLFVATVSFYGGASPYRNIILVIAVQLQYVMNYVIIQTDYLDWSLRFATRLTRLLHLRNNQITDNIALGMTSLPFLVPVGIILTIGSQ